jgi:hypothetical protein
MTAFLDDAARASLIVAVGLLLLTAVARGMVWARIDDARAQRFARQHAEPLGTWCLGALVVNLCAVALNGDLGAGTLAPAIAIGAAATALLLWTGEAAPAGASRPEPAVRTAPPKPAAPAPARPAAPSPRPISPAPASSLWAHHDDDDRARDGALWSH